MNNQGGSRNNTIIGDGLVTQDLEVRGDLEVQGDINLSDITVDNVTVTPPGCINTNCVKAINTNQFEIQKDDGAQVVLMQSGIGTETEMLFIDPVNTNEVHSRDGQDLVLANDLRDQNKGKITIESSEVRIDNALLAVNAVKEKTLNSFSLLNSASTPVLEIKDTDDIRIPSKLQTVNVSNITGGNLTLSYDGTPKVTINGSTITASDPIITDTIQEASLNAFELKNSAGNPVAQIAETNKLETPAGLISNEIKEKNPNSLTVLNSAGVPVCSVAGTNELKIFNSLQINDMDTFSGLDMKLSRGSQERLLLDSTGVNINNQYKLPVADGTLNQVLQTNGAGVCSFADAPGTAQRAVINKFAMINPKSAYLPGSFQDISISSTGSNTFSDVEIPVNSSIRLRVKGKLNSTSGVAGGQLRVLVGATNYDSQPLPWNNASTDTNNLECEVLITRFDLNNLLIGFYGTITQVGNPLIAFDTIPLWTIAGNPVLQAYTPGSGVTINVEWQSSQPTQDLFLVANEYTMDLITAIPVGTNVLETSDHSLLNNLLQDSHTIYMHLNGRAGGQVLQGSTLPSEHLFLQSTSDATRGEVKCLDNLGMEGKNILNFTKLEGAKSAWNDSSTGQSIQVQNETIINFSTTEINAQKTLDLNDNNIIKAGNITSSTGSMTISSNGGNLVMRTPIDNEIRLSNTLGGDGIQLLSVDDDIRLIPNAAKAVIIQGTLDMTTKKITNLADGTVASDAVNKGQLDAVSGAAGDVFGPVSSVDNEVVLFDGATGKLIKSSGVQFASVFLATGAVEMSGNIQMDSNSITGCPEITSTGTMTLESTGAMVLTDNLDDSITLNRDASTGIYLEVLNVAKQITFNSQSNPVKILGTGLDMSSLKISNVLDPTAAQDGATKNYVDTQISSAVASSYGEMGFVQNATNTVIALANTPVAVAGTFVAGLLNNFTVSAAGVLTYTGTATINVRVSSSWCWEVAAGTAEEVYAVCRKNGADITKSRIESKLNDTIANYPRNCSMDFMVSMAQNDTLQMFVAVINDTDDLLYQSMQFVCTEIK